MPTPAWKPDAFEWTLLGALVLMTVVTSIRPKFPDQTALNHIPTGAAVLWLAFSSRFYPLSRTSFALVIAFLMLHVLGARYSYSFVPYDDWSRRALGFGISEELGWTRNHFDRLVHLSFGLLVTPAVREVFVRHIGVTRKQSLLFALLFIMSASMFYELVEWAATFTLAPEQAETFNGQQGDPWDAHKDMALATGGALVAILAMIVVDGRERRSQGDSEERREGG